MNPVSNSAAGVSWDSRPVPGVSVSDLNLEALDTFRDSAVRSGHFSKEDASISNTALLQKLNLFYEDQLKLAAVLLFHPEPSQFAAGAYIRVGKFKLVDDGIAFQDVLQFSDDVYGPLFLMMDKTMDLLHSKYFEDLPSRSTPSVPVKMLSDDVAREMLINAIAHKDYASGIPIRVSVHEDRMNVFNTGIWPAGLPVDEQIYGNHESLPRNPLLTEVFRRAGLMAAWGTGFLRMRDHCIKTHSRAPVLRVRNGTVSLYAHCRDEYWSLLDLNLTAINNDPRLDMLDPDADFKEICRRMGVPAKTLVPMVQKMLPDRDFSKLMDYDEYDDL